MSLPKDKAWFPAKTYGWGWGFPTRWQGWVVMVAFVAALIFPGIRIVTRSQAGYVAYAVGLCVLLVAICLWKGEAPAWRWGDRPGSRRDS